MAEKLTYKNQERVELGRVEGDIEMRNCTFIVPQQGRTVVITGLLKIDGETTIEGSLKVGELRGRTSDLITIEGDLEAEGSATVEKGGLEVRGSATGKKISADSSLSVERNLKCSVASAGGSLRVGGNATSQRLMSGGSVSVKGDTEVERVDAGGSVTLEGNCKCEEVSAGGSAKCSTGRIGKVSVGGSFKAEGAVSVDEIDVGGSAVVGPGSYVKSIDVGGSFRSTGDIKFDEIDVGGTVRLEGPAEGRFIDVGGTLDASDSLHLLEDIEVGGKVEIGGDFKCDGTIRVGGVLNVEGRIDTHRIAVGGRVQAAYIKASDEFRIGSRGEVGGPVEARKILIRERARADSLYGDEIRLEERARVRDIYGKEVYLEDGVIVEGEVIYTDSLEVEDNVRIRVEPKKVNQLPPPGEVLHKTVRASEQ